MSQSTLDDDELFGEAANEMRADVEDSLAAAWDELPDPDDVWETDADNVLGVLNGLRSALDVGDAKKWFTMGQRADAFDDADDLEAEIEDLESVIEDIGEAGDQVGDLTSTIPGLKSTLESAHDEDEDDE